MLFIATLPNRSRRLATGINEAEAVQDILDRLGIFPDKIEVASWYTLEWENDS